MKTPLTLGIVLMMAIFASAQTSIMHTNSAREVVQEFVKVELEGARLTPEGRLQTTHLLVQPSSTPPDPIDIVSDTFEIQDDATVTGVKLNVHFPFFYGWLDSALRFTPAPHVAPGNGILKEGISLEYTVVPAGKQSEAKSNARQAAQKSAQEWRIENLPSFSTINLAAAIRYVSDMRDKATDPAVKSNANQTLTKLKKLQSSK